MSSAPHSESATPLETREQRDRRIEIVGRARAYIEGEKHPSTSLVNGDTIKHLAEWFVYVSGLLDRALDNGAEHPPGAKRTQTKPAESPAVGEGR